MTCIIFRFRKLLFPFFIFFISSLGFSQQVSFVYLQTENHQPFYVRMGEKIQSSTSTGYLLLSNLIDSSYSFNIGLQGNKPNEKKYTLEIHNKDFGFLLKTDEVNNWALFNLQTNEVLESSLAKETVIVKSEKRTVSAFTEMLALAADDSTLKETQIIVRDEIKKTPPIELKKAIAEIVTVAPQVENIKQLPIVSELNEKEEPFQKSTIVRYAESSTTEGFGLIFFDEYANGKIDTINILIPNSKLSLFTKPMPQTTENEAKKFIEIVPIDEIKTVVVQSDIVSKQQPEQKRKKDSCLQLANNEDFMLLRKEMASELTDSSMLQVAQRVMNQKCFTTMQIKNLGVLFLTDESRFSFFNSAFWFVTDPENFTVLQLELKEEKFINLFKAILN